MAILISSWPLGIAIALFSLGPLSSVIGVSWTLAIPALVCAVVFVLVGLFYSPPSSVPAREMKSTPTVGVSLSGLELRGMMLSGTVWALYNVALIIPLSFGPELLHERGLSLAASLAAPSLN